LTHSTQPFSYWVIGSQNSSLKIGKLKEKKAELRSANQVAKLDELQ